MAPGNPQIRVGTSGWHYNHWVGRFYPHDLPKSKWLEFYAEDFDTVEINNTFYQLPKEVSVRNWYKRAPEKFVFTVKANRFITHIKRLKDAGEALVSFAERMAIFMEKLGPVLYQLPPSMHKDLNLLKQFGRIVPKDTPPVFEFRHKSWFSKDTFRLLDKCGLGFCVHDMPGIESPRVITAEVIYVRFHGSTGQYEGNYTDNSLENWAGWITDHKREVKSIYAYFNNDLNAYAVYNAKTLRAQLTQTK